MLIRKLIQKCNIWSLDSRPLNLQNLSEFRQDFTEHSYLYHLSDYMNGRNKTQFNDT